MKLLRFRMKKLSDLRVPVLEPKSVKFPKVPYIGILPKMILASFGIARKDKKKD